MHTAISFNNRKLLGASPDALRANPGLRRRYMELVRRFFEFPVVLKVSFEFIDYPWQGPHGEMDAAAHDRWVESEVVVGGRANLDALVAPVRDLYDRVVAKLEGVAAAGGGGRGTEAERALANELRGQKRAILAALVEFMTGRDVATEADVAEHVQGDPAATSKCVRRTCVRTSRDAEALNSPLRYRLAGGRVFKTWVDGGAG